MSLVLGIDPGSRKTGFGIIEAVGPDMRYVTSGIVRLTDKPLPERLKVIFHSLSEIIAEYRPEQMAIEEVFLARDPRAALRLGQARGAAIVAAVAADLEVFEYSARTVKKSVVGTGAATKEQVQHMVMQLLKLPAAPAEDAADGLAVAMCHAQSMRLQNQIAGVTGYSRNRLR